MTDIFKQNRNSTKGKAFTKNASENASLSYKIQDCKFIGKKTGLGNKNIAIVSHYPFLEDINHKCGFSNVNFTLKAELISYIFLR